MIQERKDGHKASTVYNASFCDMYGTVCVINNTIQFLSDAGQVMTIDLPSWQQHGCAYGEVGLAMAQQSVDRMRFEAEKAALLAGSGLRKALAVEQGA